MERLIKQSRFPALRTFEGYEFDPITFPSLLFNVISAGYQRQSVIVTSTLEFGWWTEVFGDDRLTAALIDRFGLHVRMLGFSGQSYRYKQAVHSRGGDGQDRQDSVLSPS